MAGLKTKPNDLSPMDYLNSVDDEQKKQDSIALLELMSSITGHQPKIWGQHIIGFGSYHYVYPTGQEGDWFKVGFAPRKQYLSVYLSCHTDRMEALRQQLGKHKSGKACLNIKKLEDIKLDVLQELIQASIAYLDEKYPD